MTKLRLFLAINLPEPVRDRLVSAQMALAKTVSKDAIRWARPEQLHLTLKFLGHLPLDVVSRLERDSASVCGAFAPLELMAEGLGAFPNPKRPRIIWAGVSGYGLADLQARLEQACCSSTNEPPDKPFKGHITLGRVKHLNRKEIEAIASGLKKHSEIAFGRWSATCVDLMQSQLSPTGSKYSVFRSFGCLSAA